MKQQEPTNKELLEAIAILTELTTLIIFEYRRYYNNLKVPPETRGEMRERAEKLMEISKRVNLLCEKSQDLVLEHKDLLNLDILGE